MLEQVHDALWIAEGENVSFYGAPYPTRSIIARLENGDLWIWSPVKLTADLRADVDRLGPVRHLVSPNKLHHLYLKEWKEAYPEAALWGPRSTIKKRPDLSFREPLTDSPPHEWLPDIDQAWFRGSFAMDEIVFFHRAFRHRDRRRPDPDLQRSLSPQVLGVVALLGAPRWSYPGPGRRAARMETIVYQSRAGTAGTSEGTQLELSARYRRARRVGSRWGARPSSEVISLAGRLIDHHRGIVANRRPETQAKASAVQRATIAQLRRIND